MRLCAEFGVERLVLVHSLRVDELLDPPMP